MQAKGTRGRRRVQTILTKKGYPWGERRGRWLATAGPVDGSTVGGPRPVLNHGWTWTTHISLFYHTYLGKGDLGLTSLWFVLWVPNKTKRKKFKMTRHLKWLVTTGRLSLAFKRNDGMEVAIYMFSKRIQQFFVSHWPSAPDRARLLLSSPLLEIMFDY